MHEYIALPIKKSAPAQIYHLSSVIGPTLVLGIKTLEWGCPLEGSLMRHLPCASSHEARCKERRGSV